MALPQGGFGWFVTPNPTLFARMSALPPGVQKEVRKNLRQLVRRVQRTARGNASWSSRIPGAIGTTVRKGGAGLRVNAGKAPHARPFEGMGGRGSFRHPVFGNRSVWVSQRTRPFVQPAVDAHRDEVNREAEDAVNAAARKLGFFSA